ECAPPPTVIGCCGKRFRIHHSRNHQQIESVNGIERVDAFDNLGGSELPRHTHDPSIFAPVEKKLLHGVAEIVVPNQSAEPFFKFAEAIYARRAVASSAACRSHKRGDRKSKLHQLFACRSASLQQRRRDILDGESSGQSVTLGTLVTPRSLQFPSSHSRSAVDGNGTHFSSTLNPLALDAQPGRSLIHAIKCTPQARINMLAEVNVEV